jgi:hypothetical protein
MIFPDRMFIGDWLRDPRLRRLTRHLQLLLLMLRHLSDRDGRFGYSPADVHRALYVSVEDNVSLRDVEEWMEKLRSLGFIKSYTGSNGQRVGEISRDYWRQKLAFGKSVFEAEGSEPQLDLSADPPARARTRRSDMKRSDTSAGPSAAGEGDFPILYFSDRLLLTMCQLEGSDPALLTPTGKRKIQSALSAIRKVKADLHPDDLVAAAGVWRKVFPTATLTAHALSVHWAKLMAPKAPKAVAQPEDEEPMGWRDWINEHTPDVPYARDQEKEGTPWHELTAAYRRYLIEQLKKPNRPAA